VLALWPELGLRRVKCADRNQRVRQKGRKILSDCIIRTFSTSCVFWCALIGVKASGKWWSDQDRSPNAAA